MATSRLDTSFHESFSLNRPALSKVLAVCAETQGQLTAETIRARTDIGTNYVKAMPRYGRGCGLVSFGSYRLTCLGNVVCAHDPNLDSIVTQWIMHYHLSAPHGPGPIVWHYLVTSRLRFSEELRPAHLATDIGAFIQEHSGKSLGERTARTAATVFVGTYSKSDALGKLGLLASTPTGGYRALETEPPPVGVFAYLLADFWANVYENRVTVNLDELASPGGFADVLRLNSAALNELLRESQHRRLLDVQRAVPPYQVVRLWSEPGALIGAMYE